MYKYLYILLISIVMFSACSEKDKTAENEDDQDTTQLTKGVLFSAVMLNDFLQLEDDEDLGLFLENEIYPLVAGSPRVSMDRLSGSEYLVTYDSAGQNKNLIIQRFYNPKGEHTFFVKTVPTEGDTEKDTETDQDKESSK